MTNGETADLPSLAWEVARGFLAAPTSLVAQRLPATFRERMASVEAHQGDAHIEGRQFRSLAFAEKGSECILRK